MHFYDLSDYSGNAWHYIARLHPDPITAVYKALSSIERVLGTTPALPPLRVNWPGFD